MTESFDEFLKAKRMWTVSNIEGDGWVYVIKQQDLGEWAWQRFSELYENPRFFIDENKPDWVKQLDNYFKEECFEGRLAPLFFEMVLACLGEAELKKRLKELK